MAEGTNRSGGYHPREDEERLERAARRQAAGARRAAGDLQLYGVRVTHPDRVLWAEQGLTKRGLIDYYAGIAAWILPHLTGRPLALKRCPSGPSKVCFIQKHAWAGLHPAVQRVPIAETAGVRDYLMVDCLPGLVALAQGGALELHPWGATVDRLEKPDRLVLDFDPGEGVGWEAVVAAALESRERLKAAGLESFVKTTGGKGLHVVAPLAPEAGWDALKEFAESVAAAMAADAPDRYTTAMAKEERGGRIFVDYLRNTRGASAVAPYSTRARAGAPVAVPIAWEELSGITGGNHFGVETVCAQLAARPSDPWEGFFDLRQGLPTARKGRRAAAARRAG